MTETQSDSQRESSLFKTLFADFKGVFQSIFGGDLKKRISRSFTELQAFYLNDAQRARLASKGRIRRWLLTGFWLLKAMILKLSAVQRVLLVIGIYFLLTSDGNSDQSSNRALIGGLIFLLILMFELKDKLIARSELQEGHAVQKALLPPQRPVVPGWEIWLHYQAANEVGGDLLDFQQIDNDRYGIALGDVAGKGLQAALLMAKLQATLRALSPDFQSLSGLAAKLNQISYRDAPMTSFASLLYLELSEKYASTVRIVNAGHLPPLILSGKGVRELAKGDPALGLSLKAKYTEQSLELKMGEVLVVCSDGVTEARNETGELFGEDRLLALLNRLSGMQAHEIGERIVANIGGFVRDAPRTDDVSLAVIRRRSG
jgi:serine phosphatase RsbU (regulator of sigma subunit)